MDYDKMNLLALRNYARELGVKHPTGYAKGKLINEIEKILRGETEPYRTSRGRPPKTATVESLIIKEENKIEKDKTEIKIQKAFVDFRKEVFDTVDRFEKKLSRLFCEYKKEK